MTVNHDPHKQALELFHAGKHHEAVELLDALLKTRETGELWNDWATARLMCNQMSESERGYQRALELEPGNCLAAGNMGALLARSGRIAEALPFLEIAAKSAEGGERDQLLRLVLNYRAQLGLTPPEGRNVENLLVQMADVIHTQSVAMAALAKRLSALENLAAGGSIEQIGAAAWDARAIVADLPLAGQCSVPAKEAASWSRPKPGVLFCGAIYSGTGYSEESWAAAMALAKSQVPLQLKPLSGQQDQRKLIPKEANERLEYLTRQRVDIPASVIYQAAPANCWDMHLFGRARVGRTMYETDRIPESLRERCNAMDEVWVPSRFNMETFAAGGVNPKKLRFVPGGVDTNVFKAGVEPLRVPKMRGFNFVSVFDWQDRMGYDVLLRAYVSEFRADDDVALILKVNQMSETFESPSDVIARFIERESGLTLEKAPVIILLNAFMPQADMVRLYAAGHCFVLPTHGGGYGRPFLEAMACGLPVIATGWGGQMDFLNERNSYLIESKLVEVPKDTVVNISAGHRWAQRDADHLRALMREVYSHPEEARRKAGQGFEDVRKQYDWSAVGPMWVNEFRRLLN